MSVKVPPRSIQNSQADGEGVSDKWKGSLRRGAEHRESRAMLQAGGGAGRTEERF
jgi:hypothetical protein